MVLCQHLLERTALHGGSVGWPSHLMRSRILPHESLNAMMLRKETGADRSMGGRSNGNFLSDKRICIGDAAMHNPLQVRHGGELEVVRPGAVKNQNNGILRGRC